MTGIVTGDGRRFAARAVVLTTGTFLRGLIHIGERKIPAGRIGEAPALGLSTRLYALGLAMGRLKTGTPPRLDGRTIDFDGLEVQNGDDPPGPSRSSPRRSRRRRSPATSPARTPRPTTSSSATSHRAPMYSGADRERRPALLPLDRGQDRALRRARAAIRSSSSPKASTTTPSIRTASRPRCPKTFSTPSSRPSRGSRPRASSGRATPSNTTTSIRANSRPTLEVKARRGSLPRRPDQRHDRLRGSRGRRGWWPA